MTRQSIASRTTALTREALYAYLEREQGIGRSEIADDTLLFSEGLLDSFTMVELIQFVEAHAGFEIDAADVTLDNLDSIERILAFAAARPAREPA